MPVRTFQRLRRGHIRPLPQYPQAPPALRGEALLCLRQQNRYEPSPLPPHTTRQVPPVARWEEAWKGRMWDLGLAKPTAPRPPLLGRVLRPPGKPRIRLPQYEGGKV